MLIGLVSDEMYSALADVAVELRDAKGRRWVVRSAPSGAIEADVEPGDYEVILAKEGFGAKRVRVAIDGRVRHFRLMRDGLLGYAWPKWCRAGEGVQFRVHAVEEYKLSLWRYGDRRHFIANLGWYDNHGPRANMQLLPDGHFVETGVAWDHGQGDVHQQMIVAPERSGLYWFHARTPSGRFCSFPLVVAPREPQAKLAVLASTNTWNAYNPFGGRSNYCMASRMLDEPIVNAKIDLPRYRLAQYGEWEADDFAPLSFDRPEPFNQVTEHEEAEHPIEGRMPCALAAAEWRTLAWLEQQGFDYDFYAEHQLHVGTLDLDAYQVLLLNVHPEYWSRSMYRAVKKWVFQRGGRLVYLGGNGINCEIEFPDPTKMRCLNRWDKGRESRFHTRVESEANLLGVVFSDAGAMTAAPYEVLEPDHWVFAGSGLHRGDRFGEKTLHERYGDGASGHETDKISPSSPAQVQRLAKGLNPNQGGAEMVYFESPSQGEVFSAGSITFPTALLCDRATSRITANVLNRFLR